jgi:sugar phosphate isomerase/epimerase
VTRFGLSTHLFHHERLDQRHLETIRRHGFDLIELFATRTHFDYHDRTRIAEMRGWLAAAGIDAGSLHAPITDGIRAGVWGRAYSNASSDTTSRQEALDETRAAIDAAAALGCRTVVVHLGIPRGQQTTPRDNDAGAMKKSVEMLAGLATSASLRLALEVIPNDLSTPTALSDLLEGDMDLGEAGICLDFGHAHVLSGAPEAAEALSGHIITTHVHDNDGADDMHLVPFEGTIDWTATLTAMWKIGYPGALVFEVADHGDARGVLQRTVGARGRLRAILDDLATPIAFGE